MIRCDWDGFEWIWSFVEKQWRIDVVASGGCPSPHEEPPRTPPYQVVEFVDSKHTGNEE